MHGVKSLLSCLTLCDPMDHSPPGSSVHGILQARILEWVAISSSRRSYWPRSQTQVSCVARRFFTVRATREAHIIHIHKFYLKRECVCSVASVMSNSLRPYPWNSPSKNTGVGSCSLLHGIFPAQVSHIAGEFFTIWATRDKELTPSQTTDYSA